MDSTLCLCLVVLKWVVGYCTFFRLRPWPSYRFGNPARWVCRLPKDPKWFQLHHHTILLRSHSFVCHRLAILSGYHNVYVLPFSSLCTMLTGTHDGFAIAYGWGFLRSPILGLALAEAGILHSAIKPLRAVVDGLADPADGRIESLSQSRNVNHHPLLLHFRGIVFRYVYFDFEFAVVNNLYLGIGRWHACKQFTNLDVDHIGNAALVSINVECFKLFFLHCDLALKGFYIVLAESNCTSVPIFWSHNALVLSYTFFANASCVLVASMLCFSTWSSSFQNEADLFNCLSFLDVNIFYITAHAMRGATVGYIFQIGHCLANWCSVQSPEVSIQQ